MTPKEKAEELFHKMEEHQEGYYLDNKQNSKNCALVAVDEIISNIEPSISMDVIEARIKYWQQVKQEIEKL